jgi:hypothetical protein
VSLADGVAVFGVVDGVEVSVWLRVVVCGVVVCGVVVWSAGGRVC